MDRTILYRELVKLADDVEYSEYTENSGDVDSVTRECTNICNRIFDIHNAIKQVRPRYLDIQLPQNMQAKDREDFDCNIRRLLQSEQKRVRILEENERARAQKFEHEYDGIMRFWKNQEVLSTNRMVSLHRQGMFYCLNIKLQQVSVALAALQAIGLTRNIPIDITNVDIDLGFDQSAIVDTKHQFADLRTEEMESSSALMYEHDELLNELKINLDQANQAERTMREVAEMQTELSQHLAQQSNQLEQMSINAARTENNVGYANDELVKAKKSNRRASRFIVYSSLITGLLLVLLNGR